MTIKEGRAIPDPEEARFQRRQRVLVFMHLPSPLFLLFGVCETIFLFGQELEIFQEESGLTPHDRNDLKSSFVIILYKLFFFLVLRFGLTRFIPKRKRRTGHSQLDHSLVQTITTMSLDTPHGLDNEREDDKKGGSRFVISLSLFHSLSLLSYEKTRVSCL